MTILDTIAVALQQGDDQQVAGLTGQALAAGTPAGEILQHGLVAGLNVVGAQFRAREIFLPDVLLAARAMYAGLDLLKPHLAREGVALHGKVVIGSVQGDLHDIGKNLVGIMLKGAGFEVIDLGHDVAPELMVRTAAEQGAAVIGMSALLTTTMPMMGEVVRLLREQRLGGTIRTIVGGAPVTDAFAREIGADAYGFDAGNAVDVVKDLVGRR